MHRLNCGTTIFLQMFYSKTVSRSIQTILLQCPPTLFSIWLLFTSLLLLRLLTFYNVLCFLFAIVMALNYIDKEVFSAYNLITKLNLDGIQDSGNGKVSEHSRYQFYDCLDKQYIKLLLTSFLIIIMNRCITSQPFFCWTSRCNYG